VDVERAERKAAQRGEHEDEDKEADEFLRGLMNEIQDE
jgi:hypothetical protein